MFFYICCTQEDNECPRREECRRYLNANEGTSWTLFKYACTEENGYHLFMEKEETTSVVSINEEQNINKDIKKEGDNNINE